jgi:hypothetical protein
MLLAAGEVQLVEAVGDAALLERDGHALAVGGRGEVQIDHRDILAVVWGRAGPALGRLPLASEG